MHAIMMCVCADCLNDAPGLWFLSAQSSITLNVKVAILFLCGCTYDVVRARARMCLAVPSCCTGQNSCTRVGFLYYIKVPA